MLNVKKRDGNVVPFDLSKIKNAIEKAFIAEKKSYSDDILDMLALRTTATFSGRIRPAEKMRPGVPGEMMEWMWFAPVKKE